MSVEPGLRRRARSVRGTMSTLPTRPEEVPVRDHRPRRSAGLAALLVAALLLGAGCSSDASDGAGTSADPTTARSEAKAEAEVDALEATNRAYLLEIGYEEEQARCVSTEVTVDLEQLLSASDGAGTPTDKPGFEEFEAATKACIQADSELTTTTAPTG